MTITTNELKEHLRVDHSHEDGLISAYYLAALEYVETYCGEALDDLNESIVKAAIFLLVGDMYENRQAGTETKLHTNPTVDRLLDTQRRLSF